VKEVVDELQREKHEMREKHEIRKKLVNLQGNQTPSTYTVLPPVAGHAADSPRFSVSATPKRTAQGGNRDGAIRAMGCRRRGNF
jgi:hypothetical protein